MTIKDTGGLEATYEFTGTAGDRISVSVEHGPEQLVTIRSRVSRDSTQQIVLLTGEDFDRVLNCIERFRQHADGIVHGTKSTETIL
jgi:hypothetical protein